MSKILITFSVFLWFNLQNINAKTSYSYDELGSVAGIKTSVEQLPSALWPGQINAIQNIIEGEKKVPIGSKGILQRCEGNDLVVDFGRHGIVTVHYSQTNFVEELSKLLNGEKVKDFPNLTIQIGNKLMTFGRGDQSGQIHMDEVKATKVFIILYLDIYNPKQALDLYKFGLAYETLKRRYPDITALIMANDGNYYNFGFTIGYKVPFISKHMRKGYINSLYHQPPSYPHLLLADPNGRILYHSEENLSFKNLSKELKNAVRSIGINLRIPSRSAQWRIRRKPSRAAQ